MPINVTTLCENCDSEFSLVYEMSAVVDHDKLTCPFCKEPIDSEETAIDEYDPSEDDFLED